MPTHLRKVIAYVTRQRENVTELLVFSCRHLNGVQVPCGTVEDGEALDIAVLRELEEESGLTGLTTRSPIDQYDWIHPHTKSRHRRTVFHFVAPAATPDTWSIHPRGEDEEKYGYVFEFSWIPLADAEKLVADEKGRSAPYVARATSPCPSALVRHTPAANAEKPHHERGRFDE